MVRHVAYLNRCIDLENAMQEINVNEVALLDANVILRGVFEEIDHSSYNIQKYRREKGEISGGHGAFGNNWQDFIKSPKAIINWLRNYKEMQTSTVPASGKFTKAEMYHVLAKNSIAPGEAKCWYDSMSKSPRAFYVYIKDSFAANPPAGLVARFAELTGEVERSSDAHLLAAAYRICNDTKLKVTIVSDDSDFGEETQKLLQDHGAPDGRYVLLQTAEDFRNRLRLPYVNGGKR